MKQTSKSGELRRRAESLIDRLIDILDSIDGDADMEPSMSGFSGNTDDREDDPADAEPSLCGVTVDRGCEHDLEENCEDEGGQCEDEGDRSDSGIGDSDGLMEQVVAVENGDRPHLVAGFGSSGFARYVE